MTPYLRLGFKAGLLSYLLIPISFVYDLHNWGLDLLHNVPRSNEKRKTKCVLSLEPDLAVTSPSVILRCFPGGVDARPSTIATSRTFTMVTFGGEIAIGGAELPENKRYRDSISTEIEEPAARGLGYLGL